MDGRKGEGCKVAVVLQGREYEEMWGVLREFPMSQDVTAFLSTACVVLDTSRCS